MPQSLAAPTQETRQADAEEFAARAAELLARLEDEAARGEACAELVRGAPEGLRGSVLEWSLSKAGCRVVQEALFVLSTADAAELARELHGHVQEAILSPHGNYVIQKVVSTLPRAHTAFVAQELVGYAASMARHRYGCRVLCRLLEHYARSDTTIPLVDEMLLQVDELCRHTFGHHVMECVLEHGLEHQQLQLIAALQRDLMRHALNRNSSYVMEKALQFQSKDSRQPLADALLGSPEQVVRLAQSQYGGYVMKTLTSLEGERGRAAKECLRQEEEHLSETKHGRRLLDEVFLRGAGNSPDRGGA